MSKPPVQIDLMRTLDEQNINSSIAFEAMHTGAVLVMDGAPYLRADGGIDRPKVLEQLARAIDRVPEFHLKLMSSPLGLTTPAWVPDANFALESHVTFDDTPIDLSAATVAQVAGFGEAVLPDDRPLWDVRFTVLTTGQIALGSRMHHAVGDGEWGFSVIRRFTTVQAEPADAEREVLTLGRAPASSFAIPVHAARELVKSRDSVRGVWHEYWRKPMRKRVKRLAARNARFAKEYWIRRTGLRARMLPRTHLALFDVEVSSTVRRAAKLRGSLTDLLVAAAMGAVDDDDRGVDVLVPVSHRRGNAGVDARNHVSMVRAHAEPESDLKTRVAAVRSIVRKIVRGESDDDIAPGRLVGYATLMPLAEQPVWFGEAKVDRVVILPAGDPRSEVSVFGTVYGDTLSVTVVSRLELDVDAMADRVRDALAPASAEAGATSVMPGGNQADRTSQA
ncbi:wax ester/triacylglycerol synthase domain-containing protein [Microbacterium sp. R86528]|uniref:wax ester/triacylglycerol synthase domain-containing protein n=1 Tax=Microbacterium sp. R86528 TaxID=3093864 RepID=UPI0037C6A469